MPPARPSTLLNDQRADQLDDQRDDQLDYRRMTRAIEFIHHKAQAQPSLVEIAGALRLSPFHFQRTFRRWVGVSPKRYLQNLTAETAKRALRGGASVLSASYLAGLSSPGRLHDLFVTLESLTPGEYKSRGASLTLRFGVHWTPLGPCCLALSRRGICSVQFLEAARDEDADDEARARLRQAWPGAQLLRAPDETGELVYRIFHAREWSRERPFHLLLRGTNFQVQVWRALLTIPTGTTRSYGQLGAIAGKPPSHARAVASAVAANPVALLIPCHRVIRSNGALSGYRWGASRKRQLLAAEASAPTADPG